MANGTTMHPDQAADAGRRAGMTEYGRRRLGIGGKLLLAFTAIAALTIIATVIAWLLFANVRYNLGIIAEDSLPEIAASFRLAEQSAQIATSMGQVISARSLVELAEIKAMLNTRIDAIHELTNIHAMHSDQLEVAVDELDQIGESLRESIERLEAAAGESIAATHARETLLNTLSTAHTRFLDTVNPIIDDAHEQIMASTRASVADGTTRIATLVDESVEAQRAVMQLQANVNLLTAVLQQVANTDDLAVLHDRRFAIVAPIADIRNQFVQIAGVEGGEESIDAANRIIRIAIGDGNIFALRRAVLDAGPTSRAGPLQALEERVEALDEVHAGFLAASQQTVDRVNYLVLQAATDASREGHSIVSDTEAGILRLETLLFLHSETNQLFGLLNEAGREIYSSDIDILHFRYQVLSEQIEQRLAHYESGTHHPGVRETVESILAFGEGGQSILESRRGELEARSAARSLSSEAGSLAGRMSITAKALVEAAEASSTEAAFNTRASLSRGEFLLVVVAALSLVLALLIAWLYVFRGIVRRMTSLSSSMLAIADGDLDTEIRFSGGDDEITDMRSALTVFRENAVKRREAEQALRESERRLRQIFATSPIGVAIARESDGSVTYANQRMAEQFATDDSGLVGARATSFYADADERARLVERLEKEGLVRDAEVRMRRSDGSEFWSLVSMFPMEYGGEPARLAWFYDITDRKRAETELREARDRAERALDELKAAQERLIQTEKMASLGQLTAGVAHEIKNPLNFIKNFAEVSAELLEDLKDELHGAIDALETEPREEALDLFTNLDEMLHKIQDHGRRADGIVQSMLSHAREGPSTSRATDLNGLIEEALDLAYHAARAEDQSFNIEIARDLDARAGEIELYPADMMRVLLNLINNALYASHKRKQEGASADYAPMLKVSTRRLEDKVEIRVHDNGTGVPKSVIDKLFNPFFTTKPPGEGTGLGLSLSYETVVKMHGGWIGVESAEGEYTEFTITLPLMLSGAGSSRGADK